MGCCFSNVILNLSLWMKPWCVIIEIEAIERYFHVMLFNLNLEFLGVKRLNAVLHVFSLLLIVSSVHC